MINPDLPTSPALPLAKTGLDGGDPCQFTVPEVYDPAEYRWVPVKRRPRYDGWTEEKQRRFIEALADTGQVSLAAKIVGLTREGAYALRRSAHGAAFARAWDAARHHAGSMLEDIAFERAIEGREENVFNEYGEVIATKRIVNDRLLQFLLRHLKPERYATDMLASPAPQTVTVDACLREMEPQLPASVDQLLGEETLAGELQIAEIADGRLPNFLSEQPPEKSATQLTAEANAAQETRGKAAWDKVQSKAGELSTKEVAEMCRYIDPASRAEAPRKRFK